MEHRHKLRGRTAFFCAFAQARSVGFIVPGNDRSDADSDRNAGLGDLVQRTETGFGLRVRAGDQEGHQLVVSIATDEGYGPCRSCLKQLLPGERRVAFSYSPNPVDHPYNETGPVFIHADACEPYQDAATFPPEVENGRIKFPLAFRAYNDQGMMIDAVLQNGSSASSTIGSIFENAAVAFAHVRNAQFGCFVAHVDRPADDCSMVG